MKVITSQNKQPLSTQLLLPIPHSYGRDQYQAVLQALPRAPLPAILTSMKDLWT